MDEILRTTLAIGIGSILAIFILLRPYIGIIVTLVSLPVVDLLPVIPFFTSVLIIVGALTIAGFMWQTKKNRKPLFNFGAIHIVGILFIGWVFISNPEAAWFGVDRNWILTFIQLWILVWLTGELLDSPRKQHIFMWSFSIVSATAAVIAIQQGNIGDTIGTSLRAAGLAGNPNSTARYLVVAMILFTYLGIYVHKRGTRLLAFAGAIITSIGLFFTLSRTGIILLIIAGGLQIIMNTRRKLTSALIFTYIIAAIFLWFSSGKVFQIIESIMPSIRQGTDTVGLRYRLWEAGGEMWLDHIPQGVGIGMFSTELRYYADGLAPRYWFSGAHNTYISVLAETGLIGFCLFAILLVISLRNFWHARKHNDIESISLRYVWLTVFLVVLIGEITLNGMHDKLLWFLVGISVYFQREFSIEMQETGAQQLVHSSV
jgi:O-antigen ligase